MASKILEVKNLSRENFDPVIFKFQNLKYTFKRTIMTVKLTFLTFRRPRRVNNYPIILYKYLFVLLLLIGKKSIFSYLDLFQLRKY